MPNFSNFVAKMSNLVPNCLHFFRSIIRGVTQELLVEVWNAGDSPEPTFLGLCLFPVYDLTSSTPTQTRTVTLQRRPFEEDSAVGDLLSQSTITLMVRCVVIVVVVVLCNCCFHACCFAKTT